MEKTQDLEVDSAKIERDEKIQDGRKAAAAYLNDENRDLGAVTEKIEGAKTPGEKKLLEQGVLAVCLDNISLPLDKNYKDQFAKIQKLASVLGKPQLDGALIQIGQFFDQYLQQQDALTERVKAQYQPQLEAKQERLRQQYGEDITLKPEQDPDFLKLLSGTLKQLDSQFGAALTQFKDQMRAALGA